MDSEEPRIREPLGRAAAEPVVPPGTALEFGGITALINSVHVFAQAIDGLRSKLGQQMQLNPIDITALIHIYNNPDIRPTDLGRSLHMGSSGLTTLADRLVKAGYVIRTADPHDRRGNRLKLGPAGVRATGWVFEVLKREFTRRSVPSTTSDAATALLLELALVIDGADPGS